MKVGTGMAVKGKKISDVILVHYLSIH